VAADAAIGVDDDFSPSEPGVAVRATDDKFTGRIDEILHIVFE